jgi:hypothetical protein
VCVTSHIEESYEMHQRGGVENENEVVAKLRVVWPGRRGVATMSGDRFASVVTTVPYIKLGFEGF